MHTFKTWSSPKGLILTTATLLVSLAIYASVRAQTPVTKDQAVPRTTSSNTRGELVYVPIYSSIFFENGKRTLELAATLSIHNVNPDQQVTITRADYFNSEGKLIKKYLEKPLVLNPLQTTNIVIARSDTSGGTGANFLVEWQGNQTVTSPIIEAVMANASSNLGIAFTTSGKVVRKTESTDE